VVNSFCGAALDDVLGDDGRDGLDIHFIHVRSKHDNALPFTLPDVLVF
jgi:hypothetical protein